MEKRILAADGTGLTLHVWKAEREQALVLILHGLGEYGRKYIALAKCLNDRGVSVAALDWRGFGKSDGRRGHAMSLDELLLDLEAGRSAARKLAEPDSPLYLMGHSMGGNLLLGAAHASRVEADGLIVSSPWIRKSGRSRSQILAVALLHRLFPAARLAVDIRRMEKGNKPEMDQRKKDPHNHKLASLRLLHLLASNARKLDRTSEGTGIPLLAIHDQQDPLTDYDGTAEYVRRNGGTLISYDTREHTLHRGETKEDFCRRVCDWIEGREKSDESA